MTQKIKLDIPQQETVVGFIKVHRDRCHGDIYVEEDSSKHVIVSCGVCFEYFDTKD